MSEPIDETLKRIAAATSKENSPNSLNTDSGDIARPTGLAGNPNCPICGGLGYLRLDLPVSHPDFGRLQICSCRHERVNQQVHQRLFSLSHLDRLAHMTFENFQPRGRIGLGSMHAESLQQAYEHARHFAQTLQGWLFLYGPYGCGKTHLAAAIANFAVSLGVPTLFLTVPDLLDTLRFSYDDPEATFESRFEQIRTSPLLVLDDFGTQNTTAWAQEKLFQILNYRYVNRLPTVITTNLELVEIEGRMRSRLLDPELVTRVEISAPDYRQPTVDTPHHELSSVEMLRDRTFGSWSDRRSEGLAGTEVQSLEKAFQAAYRFAEHPRGWLVLSGPYGCGKTHLAAAIANYRLSLGDPPLFVVVPDLLDHLRATFSPESQVRFDRRFEEVRSANPLILDDLGTQSMTPWVREKLYQLLNYRYNAELPTVITTSDPLDNVDPRIRSRLIDKRLVTFHAITAPSFRGSVPKTGKPSARRRT